MYYSYKQRNLFKMRLLREAGYQRKRRIFGILSVTWNTDVHLEKRYLICNTANSKDEWTVNQ